MKNYEVELGEDNLNEKFVSCCFDYWRIIKGEEEIIWKITIRTRWR